MSAGEQGLASGRWARWARALFLPVSMLLIVAAAFSVPLPLYAERPGSSLDLTECVSIDDPVAQPVRGDVLLTFATYRRATLVDLLIGIAADHVLLRPIEEVVPRNLEPRNYFALQRERFNLVGLTAAAVGLDRAGYPEPARFTGEGARIIRTLDGFPADEALRPDDIVIGADGETVRTSDELRELVLRGKTLTLEVHRGGDVDLVTITPTPSDVSGEVRPVIGAELQTVNPQITLPLDISIRAGRIGGTSAGLMIALNVYDAVAEEDLVAGRRIAGTGEINVAGDVGRIGALPLKVIAAHRQGASIFLVPQSQEDEARAALPRGSDLRIVGVETIDDAITALRELPREEGDPPQVRFRACSDRVATNGSGHGA